MLSTQNMKTLDLAGKLVGYASRERYQVRGNFLFAGIPLQGADVLEVGCGTGAWAIWAALHGARRVVGIEPEADGSGADGLAQFRHTTAVLGLANHIEVGSQTLQELSPAEQRFDVVVMYDVINHLDEEAVVALHHDPAALERYMVQLQHLRSLMHPHGWVVVADCARDNFWNQLGWRSPVASVIEWHKHQNPEVWINVFSKVGFQCVDLRWSPLQPFTKLTANRLVQYLTCSHFVLRLQATDPPVTQRL